MGNTIKERLTRLEVKVKILMGLVLTQMGIEYIPAAWPPILALIAKVL